MERGSKIKILARSTKLNQILYTYSGDPQKAINAKITHPKWGGSKMNGLDFQNLVEFGRKC